MAAVIYRGDQAAFAEVKTIAVTGTWATSDTGTLTINGKSITVTVGADTAVADIAEILGRAWNGDVLKNDESRNVTGDLYGESNEITATYSGATLTLTHDTKGVPFTVSVSESTAGTGALGTPTQATAPGGPNELAANNVTGGSLTPTSNTLIYENSTVDCRYGLDQSAAGTWDALHVKANYEAELGLPRINDSSPTDYAEYRDRELNIRASEVVIGEGEGDGSPRVQLNLGTVQTAITVYTSATATEDDYHAIRLRATHASNTMSVEGGTVDVAAEGGQTSQFATVTATGSGVVRMSDGVTVATVNAEGRSTVTIDTDSANTDITTITVRDNATVIVTGDDAVGTVNVYGGRVDWRCSGTITNLNIGSAGTFDATNNTSGSTVTNCTAAGGATITDPSSRLTFTNAIDLGLAGLSDVSFDFGKGHDIKPS